MLTDVQIQVIQGAAFAHWQHENFPTQSMPFFLIHGPLLLERLHRDRLEALRQDEIVVLQAYLDYAGETTHPSPVLYVAIHDAFESLSNTVQPVRPDLAAQLQRKAQQWFSREVLREQARATSLDSLPSYQNLTGQSVYLQWVYDSPLPTLEKIGRLQAALDEEHRHYNDLQRSSEGSGQAASQVQAQQLEIVQLRMDWIENHLARLDPSQFGPVNLFQPSLLSDRTLEDLGHLTEALRLSANWYGLALSSSSLPGSDTDLSHSDYLRAARSEAEIEFEESLKGIQTTQTLDWTGTPDQVNQAALNAWNQIITDLQQGLIGRHATQSSTHNLRRFRRAIDLGPLGLSFIEGRYENRGDLQILGFRFNLEGDLSGSSLPNTVLADFLAELEASPGWENGHVTVVDEQTGQIPFALNGIGLTQYRATLQDFPRRESVVISSNDRSLQITLGFLHNGDWFVQAQHPNATNIEARDLNQILEPLRTLYLLMINALHDEPRQETDPLLAPTVARLSALLTLDQSSSPAIPNATTVAVDGGLASFASERQQTGLLSRGQMYWEGLKLNARALWQSLRSGPLETRARLQLETAIYWHNSYDLARRQQAQYLEEDLQDQAAALIETIRGDAKSAETHYAKAYALLMESHQPLAAATCALARLRLAQDTKNRDEAQRAFEDLRLAVTGILSLYRDTGRYYRQTVRALQLMASAHEIFDADENPEKVLEQYQEAAAVARENGDYALALNNLLLSAEHLRQRRRLDEALRVLREATTLADFIHSPSPQINLRHLRSEILREQAQKNVTAEHFDAALGHLRDARRFVQEALDLLTTGDLQHHFASFLLEQLHSLESEITRVQSLTPEAQAAARVASARAALLGFDPDLLEAIRIDQPPRQGATPYYLEFEMLRMIMQITGQDFRPAFDRYVQDHRIQLGDTSGTAMAILRDHLPELVIELIQEGHAELVGLDAHQLVEQAFALWRQAQETPAPEGGSPTLGATSFNAATVTGTTAARVGTSMVIVVYR